MEEELKQLLEGFSMKLHEIEEKYPDKDLPKAVDHLWVLLTSYISAH